MLVPDLGGGPDRVKLLDFGIAKLDTQHLNLDDPQTRTGVLMGTPYYMSPEQCRGAASVDDRADVYSLGVILYQMLTGRLPFIGEGDGTVMAMHIYEQAAPPRALVPSITTAMEDVVLQMLRKERESRPSMHIVARRLEELGASVGMSSDLSMTFEDSPETGRIPEAATVVNRPAVPLAQGTAANPVHTPGSQPSLPSAQITTPQPATLGPVTGQVAMMTRYKRSLMAGVAGATALLLIVGVSVFLLRDHAPKAKHVETPVVPRKSEDATRSATTQQVPVTTPVVPRKEPPPVVPPTAPEPVTQTPTPEVGQEVPQEKPIPQRKVTSPIKSKAQRRLYLAKLKKKKKQLLLLKKKKKKQQQQKANAAPGKKNISIVD